MSYDPKALEFVSGDGFTADGAGTLTYKGTGGGTELRTAVVFRALTVANTQISVSSSSATISSGDTLNLIIIFRRRLRQQIFRKVILRQR